MQPSLGPPRDEPRVFGLDKFNGDNFAEWSFKMENIFDHYVLLEVIEGTEKRPENDPEKSPWVRKSAQGYLLLGQALGSSQIRHIKPFQREPEKGPKAWAALKGVHAPATAAVAVVLERQMAALRIEEEEEVQQVSERAPTLPSRTTSAPRIGVTSQQRQGLHVPAAEEEGRGKRRIQSPNRLTYEALGKPANSALAGAALMVGEDEECAFAFFSPVEMPGEPATLKEALESSDAEEWKKAMESELKSIEENGTWELGYQQKEKVDYKELFAPVVKPTTLRTLLAGAAIKGWVVKQMDVTTAFLNGVLEQEIFMAQPEGFDDGSGRVLRLKKALYGLKQAPRQWNLKLRGVLEEIGFTPSTADHSLFMLGEGEQRSFMVVYVDDILIFSPSSDLVKEVMLKLQDKFKCKALGDVSFYLGLHIERDVEKRCMRVHQRKYLEALAANFWQSEGHVATPFPSGFKCVKGPEEESVGEEERRRFHSLVGSLMYAAVNTRPDVAFATGQLARVVQCPNEEQVAARMRLAKYLGQTPTVGLQYSAAAQRRQKGTDGVEPGHLFLTAFSDASFASEPEDMTSVGGFICCVGGGPTAWESKKQLVKVLRSDRGGLFLGAEFTKFLKKNGIRHQLTCPGTPQQNGIAERANRTIGEAAKTLLGAAGMPYKFWPEAVRHVITVKNRVLTHVGDKHWVPYERWLGKKPSIDMLRVWGCMGLVMVPKEQRHKLEVAAVWAVHLGMASDSKGWLMWDPKSKRTLVSRDVKFVEDVMYKDWQQQQQVQIGLRLQETERSAVEEV
ncbi:unnamed protein product [Closterium sp. NIES-54]